MRFEITAKYPAGGQAVIATEDPREALSSLLDFQAAAFQQVRVLLQGEMVNRETLLRMAEASDRHLLAD